MCTADTEFIGQRCAPQTNSSSPTSGQRTATTPTRDNHHNHTRGRSQNDPTTATKPTATAQTAIKRGEPNGAVTA